MLWFLDLIGSRRSPAGGYYQHCHFELESVPGKCVICAGWTPPQGATFLSGSAAARYLRHGFQFVSLLLNLVVP
jgi:hypothetical protein